MDEDDVLCRFGTALEPLEEDEIPSKKPISVEDQIVTDENGRRRFHGAFTGGFSAGFWNTVGSLEGWKPQEFKSSRTEKADMRLQKPTDFMDDEDLGEFGIAPQRVQTTEDFTPQDGKRKRKAQSKIDGPIPGVPVLKQLLEPAKDGVAVRLLKQMGWKHGQGIGARQTRKEKKITNKRNEREQYVMKMYGCDPLPSSVIDDTKVNKDYDDNSEDSDVSGIDDITFAPDDFEPYICVIKDNTFGLGYTGLCRDPILKSQHVNLFGPLEILDKSKKKLSIRGQAFGVGALEEEDEDIYQGDDITKYDFTLGSSTSKKKTNKINSKQDVFVIDGFYSCQKNVKHMKKVFTIKLPSNFAPRNWLLRKSRFEPIDENRAAVLRNQDEYKSRGLGRHDLNPEQRKTILEENVSDDKNEDKIPKKDTKKNYLEKINEKYKTLRNKNKLDDILSSKLDNFKKCETITEDGSIIKEAKSEINANVQKKNQKIVTEVNKITSNLGKPTGSFKPFLMNETKQLRYEQFMEKTFKTDEEITKFLSSIQPLNMSNWDREMEKKEFLQAKKIYQPLKGIMSDRFVSESTVLVEREIKESNKDKNKIIESKRTKALWKPNPQLCKRFNIAEPFGGTMSEEKPIKKPKFSVFDYLEASINKKDSFVTPVIIPKKIETVKPLIEQSTSTRISTKDLFVKDLQHDDIVSDKEIINNEKVNKEKHIESTRDGSKSQNKSNIENVKLIQEQNTTKKLQNQKPKTDLEKKIEESKNKHPSEKKDLFKAIFDSSSEDEDDENKDNENKNDESKKLNEKEDETKNASKDIPTILTKPAKELNVLRNTSPPRGIFAAYFNKSITSKEENNENSTTQEVTKKVEVIKTATDKIVFKSKKDRSLENNDTNIEGNPAVYGPKMPTVTTTVPSELEENESVLSKNKESTDNVDKKLLKLLKKSKEKTKLVEKWVEKSVDASVSNKEQKSKKKKKDKDKEKDRISSSSKKKSKKSKKNKKHRK